MNNLVRIKKVKSIKPTDAPIDKVKEVYKLLAKVSHPDIGGDTQSMQEINNAMQSIKALANNKTHIHFVLDDSKSMVSKKSQAIASYNGLLQSQASNKSQATLSLATFHDIGQPMPIIQAPMLNYRNYHCRGYTPLYQTIGESIKRIDRTLGNPVDVVFIIITDGEENFSSGIYKDIYTLRSTIETKLEMGWQFIYCSSSYHAIQDGLKIGIPKQCVTDFRDLTRLFQTVGDLLLSYRKGEILRIEFKQGDTN